MEISFLMPLGRLYGIGLGPGDPALLTLRALELLKSCARVFEVGSGNGADSVSGSILDGAGIEKAKRVPLEFSMAREKAAWQAKIDANAAVVAESLRLGEDCAFASIGDPLIYSTFSYLMKAVLALLPSLKSRSSQA
jgi:precorrin-2/cobalt-factor-2 C20-methyltransferase